MLKFKINKPCDFDIDVSSVMLHGAISLSYANGKNREEAEKDADNFISKYGKLDSISLDVLTKEKQKTLESYYGPDESVGSKVPEGSEVVSDELDTPETNVNKIIGFDDEIDFDNNLGIKNENDLLKLFKGNQLINNVLNNFLYKNIILGSIVDLNKNKIVKNDIKLNKSIDNFKYSLFKYINPGASKSDFNSKKILNNTLESVKNDYKSRNLKSQDFIEMYNNENELNRFVSFVLLSNFDDIMRLKMSSIIKVSNQNYGKSKGLKYSLSGTSFLGSGFTDESILTTHTKLSTSLIEMTPMLDFDGTHKNNQYLKKDIVVHVLNKLKPILPTTNLEESIGYIFAELIRNKLVGSEFKLTLLNAGITDFDFNKLNLNDIDYSIIFSLYNMFFKSPHFNSVINENDNIGETFLKNSNELNKYSFYTAYSDNTTNLLDMYDVIVSTFSKVIPTTINEVNYDINNKGLFANDIKSTIYNKYSVNIKNRLLNNTLKYNSSYFDKMKDSLSFENDEATLKIKDYTIKYKIGSNKISYFKNGKHVNFEYPKYANSKTMNDSENDSFIQLIEFIENALNSNLNRGNYEGLNYILSEKGFDGISSLLGLAFNVNYIQNLYVSNNVKKNDLSLSFLYDFIRDKAGDFQVDRKFVTINPILGNLSKTGIENLVQMESTIKGDAYKSTVIDNSGNAQPSYGLVNPISNYQTTIQQIRRENSPLFSNNPFIKYSGFINGISRRGSVKTQDGSVVSSAKLTIADTIMYDIKYDFLQSKLYDNTMKYQPTVFSDKNTHSSIHINGDTLVDIDGELKKFGQLTTSEHKRFFFLSQQSYYNEVKNNLLSLHNNILLTNDIVSSYFNSSSLLKNIYDEVPSEEIKISEFKKLYKDYFDADVESEIKEFNKILALSNDIAKGKEIKSISKLNEIMKCFSFKAYQKMAEKTFKDTNVDFVLEYHARSSKSGKTELNNVMNMYINMFNPSDDFSYTQSQKEELEKSGYKFSDNKVFDEYDNELDPSKTTIDYELYLSRGRMRFINSLQRSGLVFDLIDNKGAKDPIFAKAQTMYSDMSKFVDNNTKRLSIHNNNVLNPILADYFYSHTVVENFQQITVGSVTQHKGYNSDDSKELAAKTIAMYKRMVAHQATLHLYQQGKIDGIPYYNKVAYIKDPTITLTNVLGESHSQDVPDGAGYTTAVHRVLEQNSLNDQVAEFQGHKSISIQMDNSNGTAGLGKWAQYCISNQLMLLSPELELINKKMLLGSALKTPDGNKYFKFNVNGKEVNLDLTVDYKGNKIPQFKEMKGIEDGLFYKDPITGNIIEILSIYNGHLDEDIVQFNPTSNYSLRLYDHTEDMELLPKRVVINNVYDLWNALGGKHSVKPSPEGNIKIKFNNEVVKSFISSEGSNYATAWFVNNIGCYKPDKTYKKSDKKIYKHFLNSGIFDQDMDARVSHTDLTSNPGFRVMKDSQISVFQPLKEMYVAQAVFASAQKVGARNVNGPEVFSNNESLWITDKVPTLHSGIQLDYGHHVEESDVTEMTQIISAAVFNGETPGYSNAMYNAISNFVRTKVDPIIQGLNSSSEFEKRNILNKLERQIVSNFIGDSDVVSRDIMNKTNDTLEREGAFIREKKSLYENPDKAFDIKEITNELMEMLNNGYNIAISDQALYNKIFSTITSYFTKLLIRRKPTGIANVIMPSTKFVRLRDVPFIDLKSKFKIITHFDSLTENEYSDYLKDLKNSEYFKEMQSIGKSEDDILLDLFSTDIKPSELSMGMTVSYMKNGQYQERYINSMIDIFDVIKESKNEQIKRLYGKPRELSTFNAFYKIKNSDDKVSIQQNSNTAMAFVTSDFANKINSIIKLNKNKKNVSKARQLEIENSIETIIQDILQNKEFYKKYLPKEMYFTYFGEMRNYIKDGLIYDAKLDEVMNSINEDINELKLASKDKNKLGIIIENMFEKECD